ncbi:MAG: PP2C family protein-serine/threonine phosphatase [Anaerolineae bacterium]
MAFDLGLRTDVGGVRATNQDCIAACWLRVGQEATEEAALLALADGMGGHQEGDLASRLAVRTVVGSLMKEAVLPLMLGDPREGRQAVRDLLEGAVREADRVVRDQTPAGGTTLTLALVLDEQAYVAHVGDSRAYLFNGARVERITRDHSLVGRLQELGELTEEEARRHPQRNILYRALGQGSSLEVDFVARSLQGAALLLCTDGLWGQFSDKELARAVCSAPSAQVVCDSLVEEAKRRGADDNVSVILLKPSIRGGVPS